MSPRFKLGRLAWTPGASVLCGAERMQQCLALHAAGDWGFLNDEDKRTNDRALTEGGRLFSAYPIDPAKPSEGSGDNTLWIITEADRSLTTFLLPEEY